MKEVEFNIFLGGYRESGIFLGLVWIGLVMMGVSRVIFYRLEIELVYGLVLLLLVIRGYKFRE